MGGRCSLSLRRLQCVAISMGRLTSANTIVTIATGIRLALLTPTPMSTIIATGSLSMRRLQCVAISMGRRTFADTIVLNRTIRVPFIVPISLPKILLFMSSVNHIFSKIRQIQQLIHFF